MERRTRSLNCGRGPYFIPTVGVGFSLLLFGATVVSAQIESPRVRNQLIVKYNGSVRTVETLALRRELNASVATRFQLMNAEVLNIVGISVEDAIRLYRRDPRIEYVEPNYIVHALESIPNDPGFPSLWGMHNTGQTRGTIDADIDAPEAWDIHTDCSSIVVAVIDTGVDYTHPDLIDNIWTNPGEVPGNGIDDDGNGYIDDVHGWDFVNDDGDPMDDNNHGTHCAGTIAATGNNGIGVTGVCWQAQIMVLKSFNSNGSGTTANAIQAVEYATRMKRDFGIDVRLTSNSWGEEPFSQALYDALAAAEQQGMLFVAAAGNGGRNTDYAPNYPSGYDLDSVISVAATYHDDAKASFSNYGLRSVDLGAPGVRILSTMAGGGYGTLNGTSMATPHVAGSVALLWSLNPQMTHLAVKRRIMASVDPVVSLAGRTVSGGRLNLHQAIRLLDDQIPPDRVTDLQIVDVGSDSVSLSWTASGDDGLQGRAARNDIRYATFSTNEDNFQHATAVSHEPPPANPGRAETFVVRGLSVDTTYYFAVKVIDDAGNTSEASNSPFATTLEPPDIAVTPTTLSATLPSGGVTSRALTLSNSGQGGLNFRVLIGSSSSSGSDDLGHVWQDSDAPDGPAFDWIENRDGTDGLEVVNHTNYLHNGLAIRVTTGMPFLSVEPTSGSVPAGQSLEVIARFDASELAEGDYVAHVYVDSNDPHEPRVDIPATLTVSSGVRTISATAGAHGFIEPSGQVAVNAGASITFTITPDAAYHIDTLLVDGVSVPPTTSYTFPNVDADHGIHATFAPDAVVPDIDVSPLSFNVNLAPDGRTARNLTIRNLGVGDLLFDVDARSASASDPTVAGSGGPDTFGYTWRDSDEPDGPVYDWVEISSAGTELILADDAWQQVPLPFAFPFYGEDKTTAGISSNGYLTFGTNGRDYSNDPIPYANQPNDMIAPFWDDLNPASSQQGRVFYYYDERNARFIVEYQAVERYPSGNPETFEVILRVDGTIVYQYQTVPMATSSTVGIEKRDGSDGLQIAYNAAYLHDRLAIEIGRRRDWLSVAPHSGIVAPGGSVIVRVAFDARGLSGGTYKAEIIVDSKDPDEPRIVVPVALEVNP